MVFAKDRTNESRRATVEWIRSQQAKHFCPGFKDPGEERLKPWIIRVIAQRREPHLPIKTGLVRRSLAWWPGQLSGFVAKFEPSPLLAVIAPLDEDLESLRGH